MSRPSLPSRNVATRHLAQIRCALRAFRSGRNIAPSDRVWPAGLDRRILGTLPVPEHIRDCLVQGGFLDGDTGLRASDLTHMKDLDHNSLGILLFGIETFLLDCVRYSGFASGHPPRQAESDHATGAGSAGTRPPRKPGHLSPVQAGELLRPLLATSAELLGTRTVADVLHPQLVRLAARMNLAATLAAIEVRDFVDERHSLPALVISGLGQIVDSASERQRAVIQARLVQVPRATLQEAGNRLGVTRERVRQLQAGFERTVEATLGAEIRALAATLLERLDPVTPQDRLESRIRSFAPDQPATLHVLLHNLVVREMGLTLVDGVYLDDQATRVIRDTRMRARQLADDVGLVREQPLIDSLPHEGWHQFWPFLRKQCRLHHLHGLLALRDTRRAQVKAALLAIGHPATRKEIASACGFEDSHAFSSTLSNIPGLAKADKQRWGLKEWIDDEYRGIVEKIIQRIEEDGGTTPIAELISELPGRFNVSPTSVRAFINTPKFAVRDGAVSLAGPAGVRLRHLDRVIHGRDDRGAPYWTFTVKRRYLQGYSVLGVPPEFADALGCGPDSVVSVRIENLPNCRALTLRWRLASTTGASLGYVADAIRRLGLQPGERARVTVAGPRAVRLGPHQAAAPLEF